MAFQLAHVPPLSHPCAIHLLVASSLAITWASLIRHFRLSENWFFLLDFDFGSFPLASSLSRRSEGTF